MADWMTRSSQPSSKASLLPEMFASAREVPHLVAEAGADHSQE
jgi:hypothetical protein